MYPAVSHESWNTYGTGAGKQFWNGCYGGICGCSKDRCFRIYACAGFWKCVLYIYCTELWSKRKEENTAGTESGSVYIRNLLCSDICVCVHIRKAAYDDIC